VLMVSPAVLAFTDPEFGPATVPSAQQPPLDTGRPSVRLRYAPITRQQYSQ